MLQRCQAAIINILTLTKDLVTTCNVKGVAGMTKPRGNYPPTLQFLPALWSVLIAFNSVLLLWPATLMFNVSVSHQAAVFGKKNLYATCPASNGRQTKLVAEHSRAFIM